nr:acetate kinase [Acetatifactor sp.]
ANLIGIHACQKLMPNTPMVAVFDTSFHQTMPEEAYMYGLPYEYYKKYKVRRYGFHGTSHSYVSKRAAEILGVPYESLKIIVCHLGNGASISAVKNGKCVDTSMGLTPLEGLIMGTRCGDVDPAILEFIAKKENMDLPELMNVLNKKSGVLGLSDGLSSDFRDIEAGYDKGDENAVRAMNTYCYHVAKYVGSYVAAMNGVDVIAFTAGVGENGPLVRRLVCEHFGFLGVELDPVLNAKRGEDLVISTPNSKVKVMMIPTNEELAIARETVRLVK